MAAAVSTVLTNALIEHADKALSAFLKDAGAYQRLEVAFPFAIFVQGTNSVLRRVLADTKGDVRVLCTLNVFDWILKIDPLRLLHSGSTNKLSEFNNDRVVVVKAGVGTNTEDYFVICCLIFKASSTEA